MHVIVNEQETWLKGYLFLYGLIMHIYMLSLFDSPFTVVFQTRHLTCNRASKVSSL